MLKHDNHYYTVSQNHLENKYLFEVKNHPKHLCSKPTEVYPRMYNSIYDAIHYGGFDMKTGWRINELSAHFSQYQNNTFFSMPWSLYVYSPQLNQPTPMLTVG